MSGFEADLYECLSRTNGLKVVPQWPSRNKSIDLVITDEAGRRLAVEADGSHHHEDRAGHLIPEDRERQALLEEAGWTFCRVAHRDFIVAPNGVLHRILDVLAERPENAILARAMWIDQAVVEALEETIEIAAVNTVDALSDAPESAGRQTSASHAGSTGAAEPTNVPAATLITATPVPNHPEPAPAAVSDRVAFDDLPLADMIVRIVEVVLARGSVPAAALARIFAEVHRIVPSARRRPLSRFAWTAKGKRYLDQAGENWIAGERLALRDEAYGDWTMNSLIERAAEMLIDHDDPFDSLLTQFYSGARVPKLAMSLVGSAINTRRATIATADGRAVPPAGRHAIRSRRNDDER